MKDLEARSPLRPILRRRLMILGLSWALTAVLAGALGAWAVSENGKRSPVPANLQNRRAMPN